MISGGLYSLNIMNSAMSSQYVVTTIQITEEQKQFINKNFVCLSKLVREALDQRMKPEGAN